MYDEGKTPVVQRDDMLQELSDMANEEAQLYVNPFTQRWPELASMDPSKGQLHGSQHFNCLWRKFQNL